jgi:hypothetical protein
VVFGLVLALVFAPVAGLGLTWLRGRAGRIPQKEMRPA